MSPTETLQALYDSEINFRIDTFWDAGFDWSLGDQMNGWKAGDNATTFAAAVEALAAAAREHYPDSTFTLGPEEFAKRLAAA